VELRDHASGEKRGGKPELLPGQQVGRKEWRGLSGELSICWKEEMFCKVVIGKNQERSNAQLRARGNENGNVAPPAKPKKKSL